MNFGSKTVDREGVGDSQEIHLILSNAKTCSEFKIQHIIERRLLKQTSYIIMDQTGSIKGIDMLKRTRLKQGVGVGMETKVQIERKKT